MRQSLWAGQAAQGAGPRVSTDALEQITLQDSRGGYPSNSPSRRAIRPRMSAPPRCTPTTSRCRIHRNPGSARCGCATRGCRGRVRVRGPAHLLRGRKPAGSGGAGRVRGIRGPGPDADELQGVGGREGAGIDCRFPAIISSRSPPCPAATSPPTSPSSARAPRSTSIAQAFGAVAAGPRLTAPDGSIVHAEVRIGGATVMLSEHNPAFGTADPRSLGGTPVRLALTVENADATVEAAARAGAQGPDPGRRPVLRASRGTHRRPVRARLDRLPGDRDALRGGDAAPPRRDGGRLIEPVEPGGCRAPPSPPGHAGHADARRAAPQPGRSPRHPAPGAKGFSSGLIGSLCQIY